MKLPWSAGRVPTFDGYRRAAVVAVALACIVLAGSGFVWFGHRAWMAFVPQLTPSCSRPVRVHGKATREQAGLVRCYLQATADHDAIGLNVLAGKGPFARIGNASFAHSADARAGLATATFTPSQMASTYVLLTIDYADGASEKTGLMNMIALGGSSAWRMTGT